MCVYVWGWGWGWLRGERESWGWWGQLCGMGGGGEVGGQRESMCVCVYESLCTYIYVFVYMLKRWR